MMIVNKASYALLALTGFLSLSPASVKAADVVPSLYDVQDISVNLARLGNETASTNCGVFRRKVSDQTLSFLLKDGLPARSSMAEHVKDKNKVSVNLIPEVTTIQPSNKRCLSWVSFSVQSHNAINLPPTKYHRELRLNYWNGGLLVSTSQHSHHRGIKEAINKLTGQLARQYSADQPPKLK